MSKEKQIEEMWNIIITDCDNECVGCEFENDNWCFTHRVINDLYNGGYRKQEWISVEERLPEECKNVLCFAGNKMVIAFMEKTEDCGEYVPVFWDWLLMTEMTHMTKFVLPIGCPFPNPRR